MALNNADWKGYLQELTTHINEEKKESSVLTIIHRQKTKDYL